MNDATPEPRTPVMIMVEASWEDQSGTVQSTRARMENKSPGGACIRLNKHIAAGTKLRIYGRWEKFCGEARYCRKEGRDYLVGIQKDRTGPPLTTRLPAKEVSTKESESVLPADANQVGSVNRQEESKTPETAIGEVGSVPIRGSVDPAAAVAELETTRETWSKETRNNPQAQGLEGLGKKEEQLQQPSAGKEAGKERKHMRRKWFDMGHKDEKQEGLTGVEMEKGEQMNRMPVTIAPAETIAAETDAEDGSNAQVDLLSMEDIYRMAGILNPRKGYSINKIVEMLHSEHLRGLSKEMKRASVLMALDAAGIPVEEVLQDAKARQDAIDSYESEQRKQFEAQLARKAEENVQIQAELERVKARYTERLRRNLDGMSREKATFGNWLTLKQQEAQSITEAVDLCLKPPAPEAPSNGLEEVSLAGARVKPV
jgi:hypothetical protein